MTWEVLWALILGFALSGAVQAVVSKQQMRRLLPDDSPRTLTVAAGLGAASSSCSYAAVALWMDVFGGLLIAGALAAWVPNSFWQGLFLQHRGALATIWGPLIGPLVAMLSFVCSIGNVPLAAVLWNGGISFGGVLAFIFADLIILPILDIYRRYYGLKMAAFILATFYVTMAAAGLAVEFLFAGLRIQRTARDAKVA